MRVWDLVFPLVREAVALFVYDSFYPSGWRERQVSDLAAVLDDEPENVAVAMDAHHPAGWVCTRPWIQNHTVT